MLILLFLWPDNSFQLRTQETLNRSNKVTFDYSTRHLGNIGITMKYPKTIFARSSKQFSALIDWLNGWLFLTLVIGWFVHLLADWLTVWMVGILIDWLFDWLTDWLIVWMVNRLIDWLFDWLTDWLTVWVVVRLMNYWMIDKLTG